MAQCVVAPAGVISGLKSSASEAASEKASKPATETGETFFQALDGRHIMALGRRWRVEVFSVLELVGRRYVQLAVEGPARYLLTLRMQPGAQSRHVIPALVPWLLRPTASGEVLDVPSDGSGATQARPRKNNVIPWRD